MIVAKEDRLHPIFKSTNYVFIVLCSTSFLFVTEISLGVYVYRAKSDIHEVYLKEIRSDKWRNEIREILNDPKFYELHGCFKKKIEDDRIWKSSKVYEELLVTNKNPTRKKRSAMCEELESEGCLTKGEPGIQGSPGVSGTPGIPGQKGDAGPIGPTGFKGEKGDLGIPGSPGLKGDVGLAGVPGEKGEQGLKGVTGDSGLPGKVGVPGEKGVAGPSGPMGPKGDKGDFGVSGSPGLKGDKGLAGSSGEKGEKGVTGVSGIPGKVGLTGEKGVAGPTGPIGPKGDRGDLGAPGSSGLKGDMGLAGNSGEKGEQGIPGSKGADGERGLKGEKGETVPKLPGPTTSSPISSTSIPIGSPVSSSNVEEVGGIPVWGAIAAHPTSTGNYPKPTTNAPILKPSKATTTYAPVLFPGSDSSQDHTKIETSDKNQSYPGLPTRATKCLLSNAQEPSVKSYGITTTAVMFDSNPALSDTKRFYLTYNDKKYLYEIDSAYHDNIIYTLAVMIEGNAHVVDRRCMFYHAVPRRPSVIKYDLHNKAAEVLDIPGISSKDLKLLYTNKKNYLDFHVDENGLWLLFSTRGSRDLNIMKIDSSILQIQAMLSVGVDHEKFEEMFVASGVLYGIKRDGVKGAKIVFALDLYTSEAHNVNIKLSNWHKPKSATYDYKRKNLRVISHKGELVLYNVDCI